MKKKIRNDKLRKWKARRSRVHSLLGTTGRTRLTVFRSSKHIYAQLVDSETGQTIAAASSRSKEVAGEGLRVWRLTNLVDSTTTEGFNYRRALRVVGRTKPGAVPA